MNNTQKMLGALLVSIILTGAAFADSVGVVDMQEISQKYSKAQDVANQVKDKEDELQKLRDSLATQLKAGEKLSPVEKKNLEDKLNNQFAAKFKEYRDWTLAEEQVIKDDFDKAIKTVATNDKLDVVLPKQAVLQGGKDVTDEVISTLNSSATSSTPSK